MTQTTTLYAVPTSNSQRVAIALNELGLSFDLRLLDRALGEQKQPEFLAVNPHAMAPALVDGEVRVAQSGAILLYLAEKTGRLLPASGRARLRVFESLMHTLADVQATGSALFFSRLKVAAPHPETVALFDERMSNFLSHPDAELKDGDWLAGEFSIADIALYPVVAPRRAALDAAGFSRLAAWADRMAERAAVAQGMALKSTA